MTREHRSTTFPTDSYMTNRCFVCLCVLFFSKLHSRQTCAMQTLIHISFPSYRRRRHPSFGKRKKSVFGSFRKFAQANVTPIMIVRPLQNAVQMQKRALTAPKLVFDRSSLSGIESFSPHANKTTHAPQPSHAMWFFSYDRKTKQKFTRT